MDIQQGLDLVAIVVGLVILVSKVHIVREAVSDRRVLSLLLLALFSLVGFVFRFEIVYLQFDAYVGINNISFLFSRLFFVFSIYALSSGIGLIFGRRRPRWLKAGLIVTILIHIVTFSGSLADLPESYSWARNPRVHDLPSFLLVNALYFYCLPAMIYTLRSFIRLYQRETVRMVRVRWGIFLFSGVAGTLLLIEETIAANDGYWIVYSGTVRQWLLGLNVVLKCGVLIWITAFLPHRVYLICTLPFDTIKKYRLHKDLVYLHKVLALPKPEEGWKTFLKLDSLIVQLHINLLDFKIALQSKGIGSSGSDGRLAIAAQQFLSLGDDHIHTYQHLARTIRKR